MNDFRNRQSAEILKSVYKNADMAFDSGEKVLQHCKDKQLHEEISSELERYRSVASQARAELVRRGAVPKTFPAYAKMMSTIGIEMKTMQDSSPQKLAELMIRGTTMGIIDMQHALNRSSKAEERIHNDAAALLKREQQYCESLKKYL